MNARALERIIDQLSSCVGEDFSLQPYFPISVRDHDLSYSRLNPAVYNTDQRPVLVVEIPRQQRSSYRAKHVNTFWFALLLAPILIPDPIASVQLLCIATHLTHRARRCIGSGISSSRATQHSQIEFLLIVVPLSTATNPKSNIMVDYPIVK